LVRRGKIQVTWNLPFYATKKPSGKLDIYMTITNYTLMVVLIFAGI